MLRMVAILVIVLMALPMVPAQLLPTGGIKGTPVQSMTRTEVQPTAKADLNGNPQVMMPRAVAYPALINTSTNNLATQYNYQRKIVRTLNGTLHEVHESFGRVWYANSHDNGKTWGNLTDISNNTNNNNVPAIATNGTNIYIIFRSGNDLRFRRTYDDGKTWYPVISDVNGALRVYQAQGGGNPVPNANVPSIAASGTWVYYTTWELDRGGTWNDDIFIFGSNNFGTTGTWTTYLAGRVRVNPWNGVDELEPSIAATGNTVHISYTSQVGNNDIYYARSDNNGATWPTSIRLTNNAITDDLSSLAAIGNNISVAWEQNQNWNNWEIMMANSTNNGAAWGAALNMSNNTASSRYPSVVRNINSTYVVWQDTLDHATGDIFFAKYESRKLSTPVDLTNDIETNIRPNAVFNITNKRLEYSWEADSYNPYRVLFSNYYVWPNKAPTLAFTGEQGYQTDGVSPDGNSTAYTYTYRVDYTDADNDPPIIGYPEVWIDRDRNGNFNGLNERYTMSETNPLDTTYSDGKRYTFSTKFTDIGTYTYRFRAYDNKNYLATGAPTNVMQGPKIDKINGPPILKWVGDFGYLTDGINPQQGMALDVFTYKVDYLDKWNETPAAGFPKLLVDMNNDGNYNDSNDKNYTMQPINPANHDYNLGVPFFYNLTFALPGTYSYEFYAENNVHLASNFLTGLGPKVLPNGHIPQLNFTGEPNFHTKAVDPLHGSIYTNFMFRINYTHADNKTPLSGEVKVGIDKNQNGLFEANEWFVMTAVDQNVNYTKGKTYQYSTNMTKMGTYNFTFAAKDTENIPAEGQGVAVMKFYVDSNNVPPVLTWTLEDNYTAAGLWPTSGVANQTLFVYRVKYRQDNDHPPALGYPMVGIDISLDGNIQDNEYFTMQEVSTADTTYTDGKLYYYPTLLHKMGSYKYTFEAKDQYALATGEPTGIFLGPSITSEFIKTYSPMLNWTGGLGYETVGVAPTSGTAMTSFVFKIKYTDADNDLPAAGYPKLWVDMDHDGIFNGTNDKSYIMTGENASVNVKVGKVYTVSQNFSLKGDYKFTFEAVSTRANEAAFGLGTLTGTFTVARGNTAPVLAWVGTGNFKDRGVDPVTGKPGDKFNFQVAYTDADNDPPATGYPKVYIDLNGDGVFDPATEAFAMAPLVADSNYKNKVYQYAAVVFPNEGAFKYKFAAQDSLGAKSNELAGTGPTVAKPIINLMPTLFFPDEAAYKFDGLDPMKGKKGTKFVFRVVYKDPEGDQPQTGQPQLWIDMDHDGKLNSSVDKKPMVAENSGDLKTGRIYRLELTLDPGYNYIYAFSVINTANQTAYQGVFRGPIVDKEVKTTPSGMGDMVWLILLIIAVIVALIIGLLIGRSRSKKAQTAMAEIEPRQREPQEMSEEDTSSSEGQGEEPERGGDDAPEKEPDAPEKGAEDEKEVDE